MTALTQVMVSTHKDRPQVLVLGERVAPGLVITPGVDGAGRYGGGWLLTHVATGHAVLGCATCLYCARRAAATLIGIDWTRAGADLAGDEQVRAAVQGEAARIVRDCNAWTCEIPDGC
ncbi:hypothetical protein CS0771_07580 [Catellatospora sp. IY07-71]|uniref:hypothetical protein n=1 Tax=Catellatospora sp. IY07-71 TaxID=2728827 RepID=UPI001BB3198E|nr:hypothetical protein [Catellatospora sp. IY07-71]BCJ71214.1 hypothetical protein CS0771_07580 [Catellatospora sp. IY07-71]